MREEIDEFKAQIKALNEVLRSNNIDISTVHSNPNQQQNRSEQIGNEAIDEYDDEPAEEDSAANSDPSENLLAARVKD